MPVGALFKSSPACNKRSTTRVRPALAAAVRGTSSLANALSCHSDSSQSFDECCIFTCADTAGEADQIDSILFPQDSDPNVNSHLSYCSYFNNGLHTCYVMSMPGAPPSNPFGISLLLIGANGQQQTHNSNSSSVASCRKSCSGHLRFP